MYKRQLHENPQLTSNPISRFWQKQKIKRQYAKEARNTAKGIKLSLIHISVRLSPGADLSGKLVSIGSGFSAAFSNALPSFNPMDLLIGIVGAVVIRLAVYVKGKNAKKYRKGMEYGSARWGNAEDIKPYIDPIFENNVLLTQTERLMMSSRPKHPKYARNKNVLVIGGSGSGKTRFFVKPNLMQMHSSYVVTDPKGTVLIECGKLLQRGGYKMCIRDSKKGKKPPGKKCPGIFF